MTKQSSDGENPHLTPGDRKAIEDFAITRELPPVQIKITPIKGAAPEARAVVPTTAQLVAMDGPLREALGRQLLTTAAVAVVQQFIEQQPDHAARIFLATDKAPFEPDLWKIGDTHYHPSALGIINAILDQVKSDRVAIEIDTDTMRPTGASRWIGAPARAEEETDEKD